LYPTTSVETLAVHVTLTVCEVCCTPVPARVIVGEFEALLAIVKLPVAAPAEVGANVTVTVAVWLGVRVVPAAPLALKPVPEAVALAIVTFELPLFVSVTVRELLLPSLTLLKFKLEGFALSSCVAVWPVPLSAIESGEFGALLTSEMEPMAFPLVVGAKTTLNVLLPLGLIVNGSAGIPLRLKPLPLTFACVIDTAAAPPLVNVIVCESLFPVLTVPKFALDGLAAS
jgi:hypothetical protein